MENNIYREVRFDLYCHKCKHKDIEENKMPCCECMEVPLKVYSQIPVKFEEAKSTK